MNEDSEDQELASSDDDKAKRKLRAVWISFAGRIVAQVVGAAASVVLGLAILGKYQKGGPDPIHTTTVQAAGVERVAARTNGKLAIAVLPLDSFSPDDHDAYFAAGMTEAMIAELAGVERLRVISRTSAARYEKRGKSVPEIGRELDVDLVVEGSVVKTGQQVRVTAQLIDARTDEHVWAGSYTRSSEDVLSVQAAVAAEIARDVRKALTNAPH